MKLAPLAVVGLLAMTGVASAGGHDDEGEGKNTSGSDPQKLYALMPCVLPPR
jgi:hypothetical protein